MTDPETTTAQPSLCVYAIRADRGAAAVSAWVEQVVGIDASGPAAAVEGGAIQATAPDSAGPVSLAAATLHDVISIGELNPELVFTHTLPLASTPGPRMALSYTHDRKVVVGLDVWQAVEAAPGQSYRDAFALQRRTVDVLSPVASCLTGDQDAPTSMAAFEVEFERFNTYTMPRFREGRWLPMDDDRLRMGWYQFTVRGNLASDTIELMRQELLLRVRSFYDAPAEQAFWETVVLELENPAERS